MNKTFKNSKEKKKNNKKKNIVNFVFKNINSDKNIFSKLKKETSNGNKFLNSNIKGFLSWKKNKNSSKNYNPSFWNKNKFKLNKWNRNFINTKEKENLVLMIWNNTKKSILKERESRMKKENKDSETLKMLMNQNSLVSF